MKKSTNIFLAIMMVCSMCILPVNAQENVEIVETIDVRNLDLESEEVSVSDVMTFSEMVSYYAETNDVSYEEALKAFGGAKNTRSTSRATYRTLKVRLSVTSSYKPRLDFYCETSESGHYWGILNIYSVQLVRNYNGISKQYSGEVQTWLRSAYQIEYIVNGDFYNNGTTTSSGGVGLEVGVGDYAKVTFNASSTTSSNHYKYFYGHDNVAFQS